MRLNTLAMGLFIPMAAALTGCGMGKISSIPATSGMQTMITGKAFGGQQPINSATIVLYTFGNSGVGSRGNVLARTSTGADGYFNIDASTITCPSSDAPVYLLTLGGDPGTSKNNSAIALGASLGTCSQATSPNAFVVINEISTAMLAYTFSHFFSTANGDGVTSDHFGSPATSTAVITQGVNGTIPTLLDVANGAPRANSNTLTFEGSKLITLANILGACVNSVGAGSPSCTSLFRNSTPSGGNAPTDTLQAAVNIALNPTANVSRIYNIQPASGAAAFSGGLTAAPADWTLSASYTVSGFGLGVNTRSVSTLDIDSTGRVWFPSNASGLAGVGFFDPSTGSFSSLYTGNLTHPQQVAIDNNGTVWANDSASGNIAGFPSTTPGSPTLLSIAGTTSDSVTVAVDNSIRYGILASNGRVELASVTTNATTGTSSYAVVPNSAITGTGYYASSIAADINGGFGIGAQRVDTGTTHDFTFTSNGTSTLVLNHNRDSGQVVYTGSQFIQARGGYGARQDGLCFFTAGACYGMVVAGQRHPAAMAIDGNGTLWLADNDTPSVESIAVDSGGSNSYLNANNLANNVVYLHDSSNGNTLLGPAGIGIDGAGNVWVSNYGCSGDGCTPGNTFTLSEILGAGAPTATPVSTPIVTNISGPSPLLQTATGSDR